MTVSIFDLAHSAGMLAVERLTVEPMVVIDGVIIDGSTRYIVEGGVCGFAWINVPAKGCHVKEAKLFGARKGYPKGLTIWVSHFGQSMQRKETYAYAFAKSLRSVGIDAYSDSRMD